MTRTVAYVLTALGILGVIISLATMQSDYDPVAFGIATVSILVAIVGISLVLKAQDAAGMSDKRA